jgi:formyl-CoA transferase
VPLCDLVCGLYLAMGVLAALHERARTGEGQTIDVSLLESGCRWPCGRPGGGSRPARCRSASAAPTRARRRTRRSGPPTAGRRSAPSRPRRGPACAARSELTDLLEDDRFATSSSRHALREEVVGRVEGATSQLSTAEVVGRLEAEGVPCAPISDFGQVFTDEHLAARDFFWDAAAPGGRPVRQLGSPMRFSRSATQRGARARPRHRDARGAAVRSATASRRSTPCSPAARRGCGRDRRAAGAPRGGVLTVVFDRPAAATP